jgi:gamma-glutamylcyclotransferase (GGCT)/AIG2-like uncharacterized protein YtfP
MQELLFSYGTLQKDKVQQELFGRLLSGTQDALKGYTLSTIEIKDASVLEKSEQPYHLIAIPSTDHTAGIEGTVYTITSEELRQADLYETDDYKRVKATLQSGKEAWVYVAV